MEYRVVSLSVSGRHNKIYRSGQTVKDTDFRPGVAEKLETDGHLKAIVPTDPETAPIPPNESIKIAIVSAVWKRPEVFKMFAKGIQILKENSKVSIEVIISGSEGIKSRSMVESEGFHYIEIPNEPLAEKVNAPVSFAKKLGVSHVICVGSDDIITPELLEIYIQYMREGYDYIGVTDFYFYDTITKKALYWGGYREKWRVGHTCGAGRVLSARLLNIWNWKPWENKHNRILDTSIQEKLRVTPHSKKIFSLKSKGVFALDIKSSTNMTPFKVWDNAAYIDSKIIKSKFPYVCAV